MKKEPNQSSSSSPVIRIRPDTVRKPFSSRPRNPDERVFICGEAYSINQGWVEGALQTAELMLEEHFGLKRPSWLPSDYSLGY